MRAGVLVRDADGTRPGSPTTCSARRSRPGWTSRDGCGCTSASPTRSNNAGPAGLPSPPPTWPATPPRPRRWRAATGPCGWARRAAARRLRPPGLRGGGRPPRQGPARRRGQRRRRTRPGCSSTCSSRRPTPAPARATPARRGRCSTTPAAARPPAGMPSGSAGSRWACSGSAPGSRCPATPSSTSWRPRSPRSPGRGTALEAHLAASLARELHHSVPAQRPRARPLSEQALALARTLDDPATLAACLLARHDVLWTPGRAGERIAIAREISELAARTGDAERHAEGLLLTANALLEQGSAAFRSALADFLRAADGFRQPRHDYLAMTRRGALALLDGRLDEAERLIAAASALGERIGEPDAGNVRMSQLLGLVRARRDPERLRAIAARGGPLVGGRALARPRRRRRVPRAHRRPGRPRRRPPRPRHRGRPGRVAGRPLLPVVGVRRRDDHRGGAAGRPRACARSCWPSWSRSPTPAA